MFDKPEFFHSKDKFYSRNRIPWPWLPCWVPVHDFYHHCDYLLVKRNSFLDQQEIIYSGFVCFTLTLPHCQIKKGRQGLSSVASPQAPKVVFAIEWSKPSTLSKDRRLFHKSCKKKQKNDTIQLQINHMKIKNQIFINNQGEIYSLREGTWRNTLAVLCKELSVRFWIVWGQA